MDRNNIEKIAHTSEDRLLLAKLWDKINAGMRKNIPANTCFLSPRELEMAKYLFGEPEGLYAFGGYGDAERKMLVFLPEYLDESALSETDSPCVCLRAVFYQGDSPNHRDFLGALMGVGIGRVSKVIIGIISIISFLVVFIFAKDIGKIFIGDLEGGNNINDIAYVIRIISVSLLVIPFLSITRGYLQGHKFIKESIAPASV